MEFDEEIKSKLIPLLSTLGFSIKENSKNYYKLISDKIEIGISFNELDRTFLLELGISGQLFYPITNEFVKQYLGLNLKIEFVPTYEFVNNVVQIIKNNNYELIKSDEIFLQLQDYSYRASKEYTGNIIKQQTLKIADEYWAEGNSRKFIETINKIGLDILPGSYKLKYDIAVKRIKDV